MKYTRTLLTLVLVVAIVSSVVVAVPAPRDRPANTSPPVVVFVGETLDVSAVELTGGGVVGTDAVTLVGVAGDADGTVEVIDDPTDADFGSFAPGAYDLQADTDARPEFSVSEPTVTSVVLRNRNGANVTNGWEPTGESLTLTAGYTFAVADRLDVTVRDPAGIDVTSAVATTSRITENGGSISLDLSEQGVGTFRIVVEGSDLDGASRTITVRTGPRTTATATPRQSPTEGPTAVSPTPTEAGTSPTRAPPTTTTTPSETSTTTVSPTTAVETTTPSLTTPTTTPGFGVVVAVVALSLTLWAMRRH